MAIVRKKAKEPRDKVSFWGRSYRNYEREELQNKLLEYDWGVFYHSNCPSSCWETIEGLVRQYLNDSCPQKLFKVKAAGEPWVTNEIIEQIKDKDRALRIARRSNKKEDWVSAKLERNIVGRLVEQAKAEFLREQQIELGDDPKKFWRIVKSIVPGKKSKSPTISLTNKEADKGVQSIGVSETADFINSFFAGIGPKLAQNQNERWSFHGEEIEDSCPKFETSFEQVRRLCREIKIVKSSGFSDISTKVFKDAFLVIIPQLVYMFNLSFSTGAFPDRWKKATIIPLYKGGDKTEVGNYRPVSLLPLPRKLLERVAQANMVNFLNIHEVISDKQGGFRKGFSTSTTIASLTDVLFNNTNSGLTSLAVFIDLRKAFDTVNHEILLKKLCKYGIRGGNLKWCANYLTNRAQQTLANGCMSSQLAVSCGVPQGSVLGPLFFILYINDVQAAVRGANMQLYADDTVIFESGLNANEAIVKLQPMLNRFSRWCRANKLSLNASKTKLMVFGTRQKVKRCRNTTVSLDGTNLQLVPSYKYLGFMLDSTLSFNHHVNTVIKTVAYKISLMAKIRRYLESETALKIYKSMILPYFDYADVVYGAANVTLLDKLQRLQNRGLKICKGFDKRFNTEQLHTLTKCPKLKHRRTAHVNNFMYDKLDDKNLRDLREINTRAHDAPLFRVKIPKIETYKRSVEYRGAVQWNNLPTEMRLTNNVSSFRAKQKKKLFDNVR